MNIIKIFPNYLRNFKKYYDDNINLTIVKKYFYAVWGYWFVSHIHQSSIDKVKIILHFIVNFLRLPIEFDMDK